MDPYKELGLSQNCSEEDVKKRYRSLAQIYHPDKGGDTEKFLQIKRAFEILIDPESRRIYDKFGTIKDPSDVREEALQELASMTAALTATLDPDADDLIKSITDNINNARADINARIQSAQNLQSKLNRFIGNLRYKAAGEDFLRSFIMSKINQLANDIEDHQKTLDIISVMEELVKDYDYDICNLRLFIDVDNVIKLHVVKK